jgi:cell division protein FtsZ
MSHTGRAVMGMGVSRGANRAMEAAQKAISSPLLEDGGVEGARGVLLNITGGPGLSLHEVDEVASIIKEAADAEANIIVGQVINPDMGDDLVVTVIATGFERDEPHAKPAVAAAERAAARSPRTAQQVLAGVHAGGPDLPHRDLDRPAFLRKLSEQREAQERLSVMADDEWDVPTFLRKQAD